MGLRPPSSRTIRAMLVCVGLLGIVAAVFLPSDPPASPFHLVAVTACVLAGVIAAAWECVVNWRNSRHLPLPLFRRR